MECSVMIAFIFLCATNNVFSSIIKDGQQFSYQPFEGAFTLNTNRGDDDYVNSQKFDYNYYEDKFQDRFYDRNHPRRIFNRLNNVVRSNESVQQDFKAKELKQDVFDDKIHILEMERNLTASLTQLNQVLAEILDMIKLNNQYKFKPLHDVIKTTNFNNDRYKRHANGSGKDGTTLISIQKVNSSERDNTKNNKELERDTTVNDKIDIVKSDTKATVSNESLANSSYLKINNDRDNLKNDQVIKRDRRRSCDKDRFKRLADATVKDETVIESTKQEITNEKDNTMNGVALKRDGRRHLDKDRNKRDANLTVNVTDDSEVLNDTKPDEAMERDKNTIDKEIEKNGRRMMPDSFVNTEVKERLLHYINEGFDEIKTRIRSLKNTKEMFSNDVNFRIGYIIATLDSLDANMKNLRSDMDRNKFIWNDKKILNLYDTVKASNNAVGNLLEILKTYIDTTLT